MRPLQRHCLGEPQTLFSLSPVLSMLLGMLNKYFLEQADRRRKLDDFLTKHRKCRWEWENLKSEDFDWRVPQVNVLMVPSCFASESS